MGAISGALSKAAFRVEGASVSGTGLVVTDYPTTTTNADGEEVQLAGYDQIPLKSEGVTEEHNFEVDETLLGTPAMSGSDRVAVMGGGSLSLSAMYDGITQLMGCAMGFEKPDRTGFPSIVGSQALVSGGVMASNTWVDGSYTFLGSDVGKWIRVESNDGGEGQVRRIISVNGATATVSPNWTFTPSQSSGKMGSRWTHQFELAPNLADETMSDVYSSYPTAGMGSATDKMVRRGSFGILKSNTAKPWMWRSCLINSMTLSGSAGASLGLEFEIVPFDVDRDSGTNSYADVDDWEFSASPNYDGERMMFTDIEYCRIDAYSTSSPLTSDDEIGINEFSISLNNNLKTDDQDALSGVYRVEPMRGGAREITGSITMPRYDADTFIDFRSNDTVLMMELKISGSAIGGGGNREMYVYLPSIKITGSSVAVGGADVITQSFDFQAFVPDSGQANAFPSATSDIGVQEMMIRLTNEYPFNVFRDQNREY